MKVLLRTQPTQWNGMEGGDSIAHIPHGENENDLKISFPFKVARAERI